MRPESTSVTFRTDLSAQVQEYDADKAAAKFIGRRAAPIFETPITSGGFPIMNRENFKKRKETKRAPGARYNRVTGQFGKGTFDTEENGLEGVVDDRTRKRYSRLFDAEAAVSKMLWFSILLEHEYRVAALYTGAGFSNTNVSTAWSSTGSGKPLNDIQTGIEAVEDNCGCAAGDLSLIIPRADFREMLQTTQVVDKGKYTYPGLQPALFSALQIAAMLGIKQVLIPRGAYDSKEEGIAESNTQIWTAGVMYIALLCDEGDDLEIPSAARTILWTEDSPELPIVETYREDPVRSDIIRVRCDTDEILIGSDADLFVYQLTNT